jgi:MFS family permease
MCLCTGFEYEDVDCGSVSEDPKTWRFGMVYHSCSYSALQGVGAGGILGLVIVIISDLFSMRRLVDV